MKKEAFQTEIGNAFDVLLNVWIHSKEPKVYFICHLLMMGFKSVMITPTFINVDFITMELQYTSLVARKYH